jgi:hypothetical protein
MPSLAEIAEVLRSVQKDEWFLNRLSQDATVVSQQLLGLRRWLRFRDVQDAVVKAVYYGLTTVNGYQTIGEEYAGVVQVDSTLRRVPSAAVCSFTSSDIDSFSNSLTSTSFFLNEVYLHELRLSTLRK